MTKIPKEMFGGSRNVMCIGTIGRYVTLATKQLSQSTVPHIWPKKDISPKNGQIFDQNHRKHYNVQHNMIKDHKRNVWGVTT